MVERALDVPWLAAQEARLAERCPAYRPHGFPAEAARLIAPFGLRTRSGAVRWSRTLTVEDRLRTLGSHSYLAVMGDEAEAVLRAERAELLALFPDGTLVDPLVTDVTVAITSADTGPATETVTG